MGGPRGRRGAQGVGAQTQKKCGVRKVGPERVVARTQKNGVGKKGGGPKISRFFFLLPPPFSFFFSLWGCSRVFFSLSGVFSPAVFTFVPTLEPMPAQRQHMPQQHRSTRSLLTCSGFSCLRDCLDVLGRYRVSCTVSGRIRKRATPVERTVARISREAGARVRFNAFLRDMNINVGAQDLPSDGGAQLAVPQESLTPTLCRTAQGETGQ